MSDPWFKFYPADWLSGTRGLSPAEAGVYITLIAMMYERGEDLDRDDKRLARLCNCSPAPFSKIVTALIDDGKLIEVDGNLTNARVQKERSMRENNSKKASIAAHKRWSMEEENSQPNQRTENADASSKQCSNNAIPETRSQIPDIRNKNSDSGDHPGPAFDEIWKAYPHPNSRGSKPIAKFERLSLDEKAAFQDAIPILKQKLSDDHKRGFQRQAPMFATYLNQKRWETELEDQKQPQKDFDYSWTQRVGTA